VKGQDSMRQKFLLLAAVAALLVSGIRISAHHSFAAAYLEDRTIKIEGKLVTFTLRNPHSFVGVEAKDDKGVMQTWSIEWGAASQLNLTGGAEALKPGDPVIVVGNPGRNPVDHRMKMVSITRTSDNWKWGGTFN